MLLRVYSLSRLRSIKYEDVTMVDETQNDLVEDQNPPEMNQHGITFLNAVAVIVFIATLAFLLFPSVSTPVGFSHRVQCQSNLQQISLAMQNYHEEYGSFPPAYTVDSKGNRLHSWRTLLLPMLDQHELYEKIDLSKPWDDPANSEAREWNLGQEFSFKCPTTNIPETHTLYQAVISPAGLFYNNEPRTFADVTDNHGKTMAVIEVPESQAVHWMSPNDTNEETFLSLSSDDPGIHEGRFHVLMVDAWVRLISSDIPVEERKSMITIAGNDDGMDIED